MQQIRQAQANALNVAFLTEPEKAQIKATRQGPNNTKYDHSKLIGAAINRFGFITNKNISPAGENQPKAAGLWQPFYRFIKVAWKSGNYLLGSFRIRHRHTVSLAGLDEFYI